MFFGKDGHDSLHESLPRAIKTWARSDSKSPLSATPLFYLLIQEGVYPPGENGLVKGFMYKNLTLVYQCYILHSIV